MAVLFITRLFNAHYPTLFNQGDGERKPRLKGSSFDPKAWFDLKTTEWSEFVVPWKSAGNLKVQTSREHTCYVDYYEGDKKGDHAIVVYRDADGKEVVARYYVGPQGRDHYVCTLRVAVDGSIDFADIGRGYLAEDAGAEEDAETVALATA
ncbi:MAG: hypothetical protein ACJ8GN_31305 [Longimicrobiaceae bacterium]